MRYSDGQDLFKLGLIIALGAIGVTEHIYNTRILPTRPQPISKDNIDRYEAALDRREASEKNLKATVNEMYAKYGRGKF